MMRINYFDNFSNKSLIRLNDEKYLTLLIFIAPFLNLLSGINIDLYTPSLPAIAHFYSSSITATKNTITITLFGFAMGCVFFGAAFDILGRRRVILFGLTVYFAVSLLALGCTSIHQLMWVRFFQGMMVACVSVGARAYIIDNFTGHHYNIGILYTSLAWGIGPIIAPCIGGFLQYYFGWQADFLVYAIFAMSFIIIFVLYINESCFVRQTFSLKTIAKNYLNTIKNPVFTTGIFILGINKFAMLMYPTLGAFLVETLLHHTAIVYGNTALLVSCGYLSGILVNRMLIKRFSPARLTDLGFVLLISSSVIQGYFAIFDKMNLLTLLIPVALIGLGSGIIFPNILGRSLKIFSKNVGVATATMTSVLIVIAALGIFIISHIDIDGLKILSIIFATATGLEILIYYTVFNPGMVDKEKSNPIVT